MKNKNLLTLFFLFVFTGISFAQNAKITAFKGKVEVFKKGEKGWTSVSVGMPLSEGDKIRTFNQSTCVIKLSEDNIVKLSSFATFIITELKSPTEKQKNVKFNVWSGKVYAKVKKTLSTGSSFEVQTPTAIAGVRGTEFSVDVLGEDKTEIASTDGVVTVQNQSYTPAVSVHKIELLPFHKTTVLKNKPPEPPKPMTEEEKKKENEEQNKIEEANVPQETEEKLYLVLDNEEESETEEEEIKVTGVVSIKEAELKINGEDVKAGNDGHFEKAIKLKEDKNEIKIIAKGKKGESTSRTLKVKKKKKQKGEKGSEGLAVPLFYGVLKTALATGIITQEEYAMLKLQAKIGNVTFTLPEGDEDVQNGFSSLDNAIKYLKGAQIVKQERGFTLIFKNGKKGELKVYVCQ